MTAGNTPRRDLGADCSCAACGGYDSLCVIHGPKARQPTVTPVTGDQNAIWRAIVEAAARALPGTTEERQATAFRIAAEALARLRAESSRHWIGTVAEPCWICGRMLSEHITPRLDCPAQTTDPSPASALLDALIAAARATGARSAVTLDLGESTPEEFERLVARYSGPPPIDRIGETHCWRASRFTVPGTRIMLTLQGCWRRHAEVRATADTTA